MTEAHDVEVRALRMAVVEVEEYVASAGWDQPGRLFALVNTAELIEAQPQLAAELAGRAGQGADHVTDAEALTPVEQEVDPRDGGLEELLAHIGWPSTVAGVVAAVERVVLPPSAEADVPDDPGAASTYAAGHPDREDVRVVAGVLRGGQAHCIIRLRSREGGDDLLYGPDLAPGLLAALRETLDEGGAGDSEGAGSGDEEEGSDE